MVKYESHQNWNRASISSILIISQNFKWLDQSKFKLLYGIEIMDEQTDKHITQ